MRWGLVILASLCLIGLLGAPGQPAGAVTPSPTPTLVPLRPTATNVYLYFRATPTPITAVPSGVSFDLHMDQGQLADQTINMWRFYNRDHLIDFLGSGIIFILVLVILVRAIARNTTTNN